MAVWYSVQWAFLREAVRVGLQSRQKDGSLEAKEETENEARIILGELPFLPGPIVSGQRWSFVLSIWEDDSASSDMLQAGKPRIKLWREVQFGSSDSSGGEPARKGRPRGRRSG